MSYIGQKWDKINKLSIFQDVSYVIFTGDIIDHANWATSQQYNSDLNTFAISEIAKYFPDIPILPILGNHEAVPSNV
jgi:predicted MPP superfamily phosphohydrolase